VLSNEILSLMIAAIALLAASPEQPGECRVLLVAKRAGEEVLMDDTAPAHCQASANGKPTAAPLVYDTHRRTLRAREALEGGQALGHVYFPSRPEVRAGDRFALAAHVGHVVIARDVVAMQDAAHGQRFFVRDPDGQIFVMPVTQGEE